MRKLIFFLSLSLAGPALHAATSTIGGNDLKNVFPFGSSYSGQYEQVYSQNDFNLGPISITAITFNEAGPLLSLTGNYTVAISTTAAGPNSLSTNYAANLGPDNRVFASGIFSTTAAGALTFTTSNPFLYNPAAGNLLLDIFNNGATADAGFIAGVVPDTSRVFNYRGNTFAVADGIGLQTIFTYNDVAVTPEPSSLVLLGTGLSALVGMTRRRRSR